MRVNIIGLGKCDDFPKEGEKWGLNYEFIRTDNRVDKLFIMDGINSLSWVLEGEMDREEVVGRINLMDIPLITPFHKSTPQEVTTIPKNPYRDLQYGSIIFGFRGFNYGFSLDSLLGKILSLVMPK